AVADAARWPADDLALPDDAERDAYHALAAATARADPARMMATAQAFTQQHDDSDHDPGATLVIAVARDLAGHRDGAESALRSIASKKTGPGRVAIAMLETPRFTGIDRMASAERRHARDVAQYVLVGGTLDTRTALYTATQLGAQGVA